MKKEFTFVSLLMVLGLILVRNLSRQTENFLPYQASFTVLPAPDLQKQVPEEYRRSGILLIATHPTTPPTVFFTPDKMLLEGRETDIMVAIAELLGLKPFWVNPGSLGSTILGLASHRYDLALANLNVTSSRLKKIDFVSYFDDKRLGLLSRSSSRIAISDWFSLCGQTVGAGSGTENAAVLQRQGQLCKKGGKSPISIMLFPSRPAGVQALVSGRVPFFLGPYEGLKDMVGNSHGQIVLAATLEQHGSYVGIGLPKNSSLTPVVAAAMNRLISTGIYDSILRKWDILYGRIDESRTDENILN